MSGMNLVQTPTGGSAFVDATSSAVGANLVALTWNVARGATNTVIVGTLPPNARIKSIFITVPIVSNAATTATVSVGIAAGSATAFTAAQDVKSAIGAFSQTATAGWAPTAAIQQITCTYTETGTASTTGTIYVHVEYTVL